MFCFFSLFSLCSFSCCCHHAAATVKVTTPITPTITVNATA